MTTLCQIQLAYLLGWRCQLLKQLLLDYFIPLFIFASYLVYPDKWSLIAISWAKLKSQEVETGIQKSKLEQLSSVNRAYFFTKKNKSKCRHHTKYFVMDLKVQHSVCSVGLSFLYIFILFNLTFYICIKHTKNGIWQNNFSLWACVLSSCRKHKKIKLYFNSIDICKGNFWLKEVVSL